MDWWEHPKYLVPRYIYILIHGGDFSISYVQKTLKNKDF